jgi:hypothetical protein
VKHLKYCTNYNVQWKCEILFANNVIPASSFYRSSLYKAIVGSYFKNLSSASYWPKCRILKTKNKKQLLLSNISHIQNDMLVVLIIVIYNLIVYNA